LVPFLIYVLIYECIYFSSLLNLTKYHIFAPKQFILNYQTVNNCIWESAKIFGGSVLGGSVLEFHVDDGHVQLRMMVHFVLDFGFVSGGRERWLVLEVWSDFGYLSGESRM
jgi:hypothetical protein